MRKLLVLGALFVGVLAGQAQALPYGQVTAAPSRAYVLAAGSGFERVEVSLWQTQARVNAGPFGGGVTGTEWHACVFSWLHRTFFSECATPTAVSVTVPRTGASGTIGFDLRDDVWGDTARVRLTLTADSALPLPTYTVNPYVSGSYQHGALAAGLTRNAQVSGTLTLKTAHGKDRDAMVRKVPAVARLTVSDLLSTDAFAAS
jgi:hypothetical protein